MARIDMSLKWFVHPRSDVDRARILRRIGAARRRYDNVRLPRDPVHAAARAARSSRQERTCAAPAPPGLPDRLQVSGLRRGRTCRARRRPTEVFHDAAACMQHGHPTCLGGAVSGPDPDIAATARSSPSAIPRQRLADAGDHDRAWRVAGDTKYASAGDLSRRAAAARHGQHKGGGQATELADWCRYMVRSRPAKSCRNKSGRKGGRSRHAANSRNLSSRHKQRGTALLISQDCGPSAGEFNISALPEDALDESMHSN